MSDRNGREQVEQVEQREQVEQVEQREQGDGPPVVAAQVAEDAALAFEALREERAALAPEKLVQINADISAAATIALGSFERLRPLRALVVRKLPEHDMKHWDGLQTYALAALHAHVISLVREDNDDRAQRLLDEAVPLREKLLVAAEALAHAGELDADRVAQIRAGTGNIDRGADLIALAALYTESWAKLENRTTVTKEDVQRAAALGPALLKSVGAKDLAPTGLTLAEMRDHRARSFTLLIRAYESCQQAAAYIRFREGDAAEYAPSLRPRPRGKRVAGQGEGKGQGVAPAPAQGQPQPNVTPSAT
jgi:hypothetical protein